MPALTVSEQAQLRTLTRYWHTYRRYVLIALLLVTGGFAATIGLTHYNNTRIFAAADTYDAVLAALDAQDFQKAAAAGASIADDTSTVPYQSHIRLLSAHAHYKNGEIDAAKKLLHALLTDKIPSYYRNIARIQLMQIALFQKDFEAVAVLGSSALDITGFEPLYDWLVGESYVHLGKTELAVQRLTEAQNAFAAFDTQGNGVIATRIETLLQRL